MSAVSGNVAANKVHALLFVFYHVPFVFMCIYFFGICTQTYYWPGIGKSGSHIHQNCEEKSLVHLPFTVEIFNVTIVQMDSELTGPFFFFFLATYTSVADITHTEANL